MNVNIEIDKDKLIDTLARTTGYIGAKAPNAADGTFDRISLSPDDALLVERFFYECRDRLCLSLRRHLESETVVGRIYSLALKLSEAFDDSLIATIRTGIANYFVQAMAAKWLEITDRSQAPDYDRAAQAALDHLQRKIYCKRSPKRPTYS